MEKEMLGMYLSGHPLDEYISVLGERTSKGIGEIEEKDDQERAILGGIVAALKFSSTKKVSKIF